MHVLPLTALRFSGLTTLYGVFVMCPHAAAALQLQLSSKNVHYLRSKALHPFAVTFLAKAHIYKATQQMYMAYTTNLPGHTYKDGHMYARIKTRHTIASRCLHSPTNQAQHAFVQDLEDRQTPEALSSAQAELQRAHDETKQLQQQLQQAQSAAMELSSTKTQLILLQSQLHQQREACQQQTVAAEALAAAVEQQRTSWQAEQQRLTTRAQVGCCICVMCCTSTHCCVNSDQRQHAYSFAIWAVMTLSIYTVQNNVTDGVDLVRTLQYHVNYA